MIAEAEEARHVLCAAPSYLDEREESQASRDPENLDAIDFLSSRLPWRFRHGDPRRVRSSADAPRREHRRDGNRLRCGLAPVVQSAEAVAARRLKLILQPFEPEPVPVHVVHLEGRASPRRTRMFIDDPVEELRNQQARKQT